MIHTFSGLLAFRILSLITSNTKGKLIRNYMYTNNFISWNNSYVLIVCQV